MVKCLCSFQILDHWYYSSFLTFCVGLLTRLANHLQRCLAESPLIYRWDDYPKVIFLYLLILSIKFTSNMTLCMYSVLIWLTECSCIFFKFFFYKRCLIVPRNFNSKYYFKLHICFISFLNSLATTRSSKCTSTYPVWSRTSFKLWSYLLCMGFLALAALDHTYSFLTNVLLRSRHCL